MAVQVKKIKLRVLQIQNAWNEGGASAGEFRNTKKTDFDGRITAAQIAEDEAADLKTQLSMKLDEIADKYASLEDDAVDIRQGVAGHKDFGDDSELYGAMGFTRKSERKSGLTFKKKNDGAGENK